MYLTRGMELSLEASAYRILLTPEEAQFVSLIQRIAVERLLILALHH